MRVPLSWLRDYVALNLTPAELAEELTVRGMEVQGIEVSGADWTDVVVGRLVTVEPHPNAEKLSLATVDVGTGEPLRIVCGATNISPGQLVPVALVGAMLPGERRIERSRIRGVISEGMLCSAAELGIGADADGIKILGTDREHEPGSDVRNLFGETVLDVDVKPNRGDCLSMVGLAREIAAFTGAALRLPESEVVESGDDTADHLVVRIEAPALCPRFAARYFDAVSNRSSPDWMQQRLVAAGMRPVSAVVDITNYVMHELGQPMHAYSAVEIRGGTIVVRQARQDEELETLDHQLRLLDPRMLVIADAADAIGLAGIMGGARTEVGETTTSVILESAAFHGPTVRNAARRLGLRSEASARHEKGIPWNLPRAAADRAAGLIAELTGARVARGIIDNDPAPQPNRVVSVSVGRMRRLLGIDLETPAVTTLLEPLSFTARGEGDHLEVEVPPHRLDVAHAVDVAEEVARAYGYERIPGVLPRPELGEPRRDPSVGRHRVRAILAGIGLTETVTHALIGPADLERTGYPPDDPALIRVANPISPAHSVLRPVMYASVLASLAENVRRRRADAWLYEVGKTYWMADEQRGGAGRLAETAGSGRFEAWHVAIALLGSNVPRSVGQPGRAADVADLKGVVEALHAALGAPLPTYRPDTDAEPHPHLHPGRRARMMDAAGRPYGSLGEVHPEVAAAWDLPGRPVVAAINLAQLLALVPAVLHAAPVPSAQPVDRDLAVVLDTAVPVGELLRLVRATAGALLTGVTLFDEYRGPQIGAGRVSYALGLRFQPAVPADERVVDKALGRIGGALRHHLHAEIR